ncbi:ABC transporter transmembrane domain-containing protein [Legionella sainthelensi]|uniref:ABC transporter transmembrane domain-containing protein n=1 Tax=Legionella sainthelensi TaxID=28087 RepID=UPI000F6D1308|nr:ABC transporter transmembrane domain-containing protein [Legionella sainthelensi]VEH33644.1 multidrug ABC transporter ATPase/permease [Legionella sainthelensi]
MDTSDLKYPFHSAWHFLWQVIKPYRWWYVLMLQAPLLTAFYIFANNYSFKLIVDAFSNETVTSYYQLLFPILLFIIAQITLDVVWRISDFAEWKAEPYARQRLLASAYNYVQYHSYSYFQNTPSGTVISKLKGLLDGYDSVFANIHHIVGKHFCVVFVSVFVLLVVNPNVFYFMFVWCVLVMAIMLPMALKLNQLSNKTAESKHQVIGALSDNITNIFSLFYFAKRRFEHQRVMQLMSDNFVPRQIALYRYDFKFNLIGSVLYWFMLITVFCS